MNTRINKTKKSGKGFSLIEMIVVVAIMGIIASVALPSYFTQVKKGKRAPAKELLLKVEQMQKSFFAQNLSYANSLIQLGFANNTIQSEQNLYDVTMGNVLPGGCDGLVLPVVTPCASYNVTATPRAGESQTFDTECTSFRVDDVSRQWALGGAVAAYGTTPAHIEQAKSCWQ